MNIPRQINDGSPWAFRIRCVRDECDAARSRICAALVLSAVLLQELLSSVTAAESFSSVYISEFLAVNESGLHDEFGELSHSGLNCITAAPASLTWRLVSHGYSHHLTKWRFPSVGILPDKDLVVFASGKNLTRDPIQLHTNFRLVREGNYLALVNRMTNIVSELTAARQTADVVRWPGARRAGFARVLHSTHTGTSQRQRRAGVCSGSLGFPGPLAVSPNLFLWSWRATRPTTAVTIRFTLDGTLPTSGSPAYVEPLWITNTTHLRTRAWAGLGTSFPGPPQGRGLFAALSPIVVGFFLPAALVGFSIRSAKTRAPLGGSDNFVHLSVFRAVNGRASLTNAPALVTRGWLSDSWVELPPACRSPDSR
jgi:hypothetical protein